MFNNKALFLFLILLFGLLLCSVLGGRCYTEGFQTTTDSGNVPVNSGVTTTDASNATTSANSYDNYDHYSGNAYPTTFYGPNGGTARLVNANGTYAITITDTNGTTTSYIVNGPAGSTAPTGSTMPTSSSNTTPTSSSNTTPTSSSNSVFASISNQTFYGPNGGSASVFASSNGQYAIQVTSPDGSTTIYTATNTYTYNDQSTSPYSSSSSTAASSTTTPPSDYTNNYKNNYYNDPNLSGNSGANAAYVTGPNGNSAGYATGPNGNTVAGSNYNSSGNSNGQYDSTMPQGIPASMIPQGQEDLYILKSEIVPPVCPACPQSTACPRKEKCPECPGCQRCPEPAYDCKLVPNYSASNQYLPAPVLNSFSTFGM
jgi:hypothetical protein